MYHGPDFQRIHNQQANHQFAYASQRVTWLRYLTASAGTPAAGIGDAPVYATAMISALFTRVVAPENDTPAGAIIHADFIATTRERLANNDMLIWNGIPYRVQSDSMPARLASTFTTELKRGQL